MAKTAKNTALPEIVFVFRDILDKLGGNFRMIVIGGAGIDKKYVDAFTDFGLQFYMGYGLTETSPVISVNNEVCDVHGSVGRPLPGITVAIDAEGKGPYYANACARSAIRSSLSSRPQLILISPAGIPAAWSCSSVI